MIVCKKYGVQPDIGILIARHDTSMCRFPGHQTVHLCTVVALSLTAVQDEDTGHGGDSLVEIFLLQPDVSSIALLTGRQLRSQDETGIAGTCCNISSKHCWPDLQVVGAEMSDPFCILTGMTQGFNGHVSPEDDGILAACPSDPHCRSRCPVEDIVHNLQIRDIIGLNGPGLRVAKDAILHPGHVLLAPKEVELQSWRLIPELAHADEVHVANRGDSFPSAV
mmetsp:Transcript_65229/g.103804  ORF Transcript_65229/g.103804 Transcript_65229/m.103804 type:complete len:222 (-) Transcript_65229:136-801(-)